MQLLKSLICLKGHDNGRRYIVISLACYLLLVLLLPVLSKAGILVALLALTISPVLIASSLRRINDAHFAAPLATIPLVVYWLNLFGLTYLEHGSKWVLLILAVLVSVGFSALNNVRIRKDQHYKLGYNGPVNFETQTTDNIAKERIEPTLTGQTHVDSSEDSHNDFGNRANFQLENTASHAQSASHGPDWQVSINQWFNNNLKLAYSIIATLVFLIMLVIMLPLFQSDEPDSDKQDEKVPETPSKQILHKIKMPDQFWIMLDQHDGLSIAWEGDLKDEADLAANGGYWSALTAEGDKDCINLNFTLGEKLRTVQVTVKNGGDYYADFSPVDTKVIVNSIAAKDRFKLCGYEFTLKGTGSLLRKNSKYREYLN